jgi:hypothetical protein
MIGSQRTFMRAAGIAVAQLTPIPCATREIDKTIVNETACSHNEGGIGVEEVVRR